jgi:hypothetical protein
MEGRDCANSIIGFTDVHLRWYNLRDMKILQFSTMIQCYRVIPSEINCCLDQLYKSWNVFHNFIGCSESRVDGRNLSINDIGL